MPVGDGQPTLRVKALTSAARRHELGSELLAIADRVAEQAEPGEQVEAYVGAVVETERAGLRGRGRAARSRRRAKASASG